MPPPREWVEDGLEAEEREKWVGQPLQWAGYEDGGDSKAACGNGGEGQTKPEGKGRGGEDWGQASNEMHFRDDGEVGALRGENEKKHLY